MPIKRTHLKNLHTEIAPEKTITEITKLLTMFGARTVIQGMDKTGNVISVSFIIELTDGRRLPIKLPMDAERGWRLIEKAVRRRLLPKKFLTEPHKTDKAIKVGWRVMKDWIHTELTRFEMEIASPVEIFLPYILDIKADKTFYEKIVDGKYKALAFEDKRE